MLKELNSAYGKELKLPYSLLALSLTYEGITVDDPEHWYWCVSPILDQEGKTHLFCSRWPAEDRMDGWFNKSEIVHFIGDTPTGPFEYLETVLCNENLPDKTWQLSPHNPQIYQFGEDYALIYIVQDTRMPPKKLSMKTGLMYSKSINGPWKFAGNDGIVVQQVTDDESHWTYFSHLGTDNPAMTKIEDTYYIFFKSGQQANDTMHYGYATSKKLEGPYRMCDKPKMDNIHYIEDATCFQVNGNVYLLTTDNFGVNSGIFGAGILWKMKDGEFKLSDAQIGFGVLSDYAKIPECTTFYDNKTSGKFERPGVLMINEKPAYFYGCTRTNILGTGKNGCYVLKICEDAFTDG